MPHPLIQDAIDLGLHVERIGEAAIIYTSEGDLRIGAIIPALQSESFDFWEYSYATALGASQVPEAQLQRSIHAASRKG